MAIWGALAIRPVADSTTDPKLSSKPPSTLRPSSSTSESRAPAPDSDPFTSYLMPLFTDATLALFAGSAVQAATFTVDVGAGGNAFTPPSVSNATTGDTIVFTLYVVKFYPILSYHITPWPDIVCSKGGNHTVTQSTFANPCTALSGGQDSGPCVPITYSLPPCSHAPPRPSIP